MTVMFLGYRSDLGNNELSGTIPSSIGSLLNLRSLYDQAPRQVFRLDKLLNTPCGRGLWSNQLTGSIPPTIGMLTLLGEMYGVHSNSPTFPCQSTFSRTTEA